jgi:hypothetical protein
MRNSRQPKMLNALSKIAILFGLPAALVFLGFWAWREESMPEWIGFMCTAAIIISIIFNIEGDFNRNYASARRFGTGRFSLHEWASDAPTYLIGTVVPMLGGIVSSGLIAIFIEPTYFVRAIFVFLSLIIGPYIVLMILCNWIYILYIRRKENR